MRHLFHSLPAVAAICMALAACNKEDITQPAESGAPDVIHAKVTLPEKTRMVYTETDPTGMASGLKSTWEDGDHFYALTDGGKVVRFDLESGAGRSTASFSADVSGLGVTDGTSWKAVLGSRATTAASSVICGYTSQDASLESIGDFDYIVSTGSGLSPVFSFDFRIDIFYFIVSVI